MNANEIKQIKDAKVSEMSKDEIFEIMRILNISEGHKVRDEFSSYKRFGITVQKEGRIKYDIIEKEAPTLINDIRGIEGAPGDIIEKVYPAMIKGQADVDHMKEEEIEVYQNILKETHALEQKGVVFNTNMIWEIWKIIRGEECERFAKESGLPVEQLIEMYSYFSEDQLKEIREKYHNYF